MKIESSTRLPESHLLDDPKPSFQVTLGATSSRLKAEKAASNREAHVRWVVVIASRSADAFGIVQDVQLSFSQSIQSGHIFLPQVAVEPFHQATRHVVVDLPEAGDGGAGPETWKAR